MEELELQTKDFLGRVKQFIHDQKPYRKGNLEYVRSAIRYMDQEELIRMLKILSLDELKYVMGAGICGHANTIAIELLRLRQKERQEFLSKEKVEPIPEVEAERRLMLTTAPSLKQVAQITVEDNKFVEDEKHGESRVRTPKKGRNRNSKAV